MLSATILAQVRSLGGHAETIRPLPLPEAAYLVRLADRTQADQVAAGLRRAGAGAIRHADPVGESSLVIVPGPDALSAALADIAAGALPSLPEEARRNILLEFVSADPQTPLTLVHARQAVLGDALSRLLESRGHAVVKEFYVNDAPTAALRAFAQETASKSGGVWASALGEKAETGSLASVVAAARAAQDATLQRLGVRFDRSASELALRESGALETALRALEAGGHAELRGDSLWLKASALGDDQDRVLRRGTEATYLAGDLAYHRDKLARGFTRLIDLWDADHRGYIARTHAGLKALDAPKDALTVLVCGPVRALRDGTEIRGGRYGGFVALDEVLEEQDPSELRWRLLRLAPDAPLDLPLDGPGPLVAIREALQAATDARPQEPSLERALSHEAAAALLTHLLEGPLCTLDAAEQLAPQRLVLWVEKAARLALAEGALAHDALARAVAGGLRQALERLGVLLSETSHA